MVRHIILFAAVVLLTAILGFTLPGPWLQPLIHHTAYYFVLVAFIFWALLAAKVACNQFRFRIKDYSTAILLSIILITNIFYIAPPKYKILADEANLVGVSMAMHHQKTASQPLQGLALEYSDFDYAQKIGKRPLLFPFLVSIIHGAIGYNPHNGFVLNFIVGVAILLLIYFFMAHFFGHFYGLLAILLAATCPILSFWITSSGFETLNLFFILFVFWCLLQFLNKKTTDYAELLFLSLVLLSSCRYESALFFVCLIVIAPYLLKADMIRGYRFITYSFPLLLLPVLWQRRIPLNYAIVRDGAQYETTNQIFGLTNFIDHFSDNVFVLSGLNPKFGFVPIVSAAALVGGYLLMRRLIFNFKSLTPENRAFLLSGLLGLTLSFIIYASFYFGAFTRPVSNRLAMCFLPFLVFLAVYLLRRIFSDPSPYTKAALLLLVGMQLVYFRPVAADQKIIDGLSLTYEYERVLDYLYEHFDLDDENILLINDLPNLYVIHPLGSIDFANANASPGKVGFYSSIYYDRIIVLQRCHPKTGELKAENELAADYHLAPLGRINIGPAFYIRISEAKLFNSNMKPKY